MKGLPQIQLQPTFIKRDMLGGVKWPLFATAEQKKAQQDIEFMLGTYEHFHAQLWPIERQHLKHVLFEVRFLGGNGKWKDGPLRPTVLDAIVDNYRLNKMFQGFKMGEARGESLSGLDKTLDAGFKHGQKILGGEA